MHNNLRFLILTLFLWCPIPGLCGPIAPEPISLGLNLNHAITISQLKRAAVGNSKVVKVKALPPSTLLLTAVGKGQTMVRAWDSAGKERAYLVTVEAPSTRSLTTEDRGNVVKIALEFLELNEAFGSSTGFRWPEMIQFGGSAGIQGTANTSGVNYEVTFSSAKGWIQHMIKEGWAKVLASPDLYVRLGEEAVFHSGGEFPVMTSSENYGKTHRHVEWKNFGLTAKVRPESGDKIHIGSDIQLEISELNEAANAEGIPSLTKRTLTTKMNSLDGETVILSGLIRQGSRKHREGLPILGSIPILGALFSSTNESREETELLMTVTFSMTTRSREENRKEKFQNHFDSVGN